jgi:phosphatidate cytidylyltransferase
MVPFRQLVSLFGILFVVGIALTVPLFNFDLKKFVHSSLFIKIIFWVPIFIILIGLLYANNFIRLVFLLVLLAASLIEILRVVKKRRSWVFLTYYLVFAAGLSHFYFLQVGYSAQFINLLITLGFATVLADVAAFFAGNYLGRHKLPAVLNERKSWEGVVGELIGASAGIGLINIFVQPVISPWLLLPIGVGSIAGDLANSYMKRKANIKDWSMAIPGHGGFIDRLSSLAGSAALTFWFLKLTGLH